MIWTKAAPSSDVPPRRGRGRGLLVVIAIVLSLFAGYVIGQRKTITSTPARTQSQSGLDFTLFDQVYGLIKQQYVHQPTDAKKLEYGMIKGLVAGLGDRNSNFMDPEETKAFQSNLKGEFEGIGIEIAIKEEALTVVAPLAGSPAEQAGLKSGDVILQIDDTVAAGLPLDEAVHLIRGEKGTSVTLIVTRAGEFEAKEFKIERDTIEVESVTSEIREDGIDVVRVARFGEDTASKMQQIAKEALEKNVKGMVLDLRGNPGGFLESSVQVASLFVESGTVVTEEYGDGRKDEHKVSGEAPLKDMPLVVLVDEGSASAAEILSGALQDYGRAKLVGTKSFGKGSVQQLQALDQETSLRLTVALFVLPKGRKIDHVGIDPDVKVELPEDLKEGQDPQLDKALELLNESL
jgi:carboxyl-terminal processing protease